MLYSRQKQLCYRKFIKYCVFSLKCCDFSELWKFCCSAGVLPVFYRGKTERGKSQEYFKISKKNTIFNEHLVYPCHVPVCSVQFSSCSQISVLQLDSLQACRMSAWYSPNVHHMCAECQQYVHWMYAGYLSDCPLDVCQIVHRMFSGEWWHFSSGIC